MTYVSEEEVLGTPTYVSDEEVLGKPTYVSEDEVFGKASKAPERFTYGYPGGRGASEEMTPKNRSSVLEDAPEVGKGNYDPMLQPKFVEDFRNVLGSIPIEKRYNALKAYADNDQSAYGRAARVILAGEEYQNDKVTEGLLAEARNLLPELPQPRKIGEGKAPQPAFPHAATNFIEKFDGVTEEQVAKENAMARGIATAREEARYPANMIRAEDELSAEAVAKTKEYAEGLSGPLRNDAPQIRW